MSIKIFYRVTESLPDGRETCVFISSDPFEAMSDVLLKIRKPITGHVNRSAWLREVLVGMESNSVPIASDSVFDINIAIVTKSEKEPLYKINLKTIFVRSDRKEGNSEKSHRSYFEESYSSTREKILVKLRDWSCGDLGASKALMCFAIRDPDHHFWDEQGSMELDTDYGAPC